MIQTIATSNDSTTDLKARERLRLLDNFNATTIWHFNFKERHDSLFSELAYGLGSETLYCVTGVTGVGKTELAKQLCKSLQQERSKECMSNPQIVPAIYLPLKTVNSRFSAGNFYTEILKALDFPSGLLAKGKRVSRGYFRPPYSQQSDAAKLDAVFEAIAERKPSVIILDEAQDLPIAAKNPATLFNLANIFKTFAQHTSTPLLFFGADRALELFVTSAQTLRRTIAAPLAPYDHRADLDLFVETLVTCEELLPFPRRGYLEENAPLLVKLSHGCIGLLIEHIRKAASYALIKGQEAITTADFQSTARDKRSCMAIVREIMAHHEEYDFSYLGGEQLSLPFAENGRKLKPGQPLPKKRLLGEEGLQ